MFDLKNYRPKQSILPGNLVSNICYFDLNDSSEYVPIFLYNPLFAPDYHVHSGEIVSVIRPYKLDQDLFDVTKFKKYKSLPTNRLRNYGSENFLDVIKINKSLYKDYINQQKFTIPSHFLTEGPFSYDRLLSSFKNSIFFKVIENKFLIHTGFIADIDNDFNPLIVATIKRNNGIKYLRLCHLTDAAINPDAIEIWIDESFYTADKYKNFKIAINRNLKEELKKYKVVVKKDLKSELFLTPELPKFKTIKEKKEYQDELFNNFVNDYGLTLGLSNKRIQLVD